MEQAASDWRLFRGMKFKKNPHGMSFTEIVFAIAIVAGILLVMIGVLIRGLESFQKSNQYNQGTIIARRIIEEFKSREYADITLYDPEITLDPAYYDDFDVKVKIIEDTYSNGLDYKKLTVSVRKEGQTASKSVNILMETFFVE